MRKPANKTKKMTAGLAGWFGFNATFSTTRLYRAFKIIIWLNS